MDLTTFQAYAETVRARAERIARAQYALANAAGIRAGLGVYRNVWSNAQIGKRWAEVDYDALREAEYHDRIRDVAYQLADRIIARGLARYESSYRTITPRLTDRAIVGPVISWSRPYRDGRIDKR